MPTGVRRAAEARAKLADAPGDCGTKIRENGVCASEVDRVELQSPQGAGRTDHLRVIVGRSYWATSTTDPLPSGRVLWGKHLGDVSKISDLVMTKSTG